MAAMVETRRGRITGMTGGRKRIIETTIVGEQRRWMLHGNEAGSQLWRILLEADESNWYMPSVGAKKNLSSWKLRLECAGKI
jgi:hypothetical protein